MARALVYWPAGAVSGTTDHDNACRRVAAQFSPGWLRCYVAAKIRNDPAFPAVFDLLRESDAPILDLGCGVGLLAAYLRERGCRQPVIGIDCDGRKVALARQAAARAGYRATEFRQGDATERFPSFNGNVALLDMLHYLRRDEQRTLLSWLPSVVPAGGVVAIRDAPRERSARFLATYVGEKFAQAISWNVGAPLNFPTSESLRAAFASEQFDAESQPLWGRTPFNNYMFIFRRRSPAAVAVAG